MRFSKSGINLLSKNILGGFMKKYGYRFDAKFFGFKRKFNGGFNPRQ